MANLEKCEENHCSILQIICVSVIMYACYLTVVIRCVLCRPVPLCGCVPAEDKYKAKPGSHVSMYIVMSILSLHLHVST